MARMKYVQRRANRFEFRFPLPDDLAGKPFPQPWPDSAAWCINPRTGRFKTELIRSLKTTDSRTAERAALPLIEEAHRLVDFARDALERGVPETISASMIAELAAHHEASLMKADDNVRQKGLGLDVRSGKPRPHDDGGMTEDDIEIYRRAVIELDSQARNESARMRGGDALNFAINRAVDSAGIVLHPNDPAWRELELAFIKAQRRALAGIRSRLEGELVETPILHSVGTGDTITKATQRWAEGGGRAASKPRANSINEAMRAVQRFVELHGDLELTAVTKVHARQYRDALAKVPKRLPHKLARLTLPKLLERDLSAYEPRNAQTVNKYLNLLSGIFRKSEKDGFFEQLPHWTNPFHVGFDISAIDRETFEPFTVEELQKLFASPVFKEGKRPLGGRGEAAFWLPFLSLYTGARRTELAQLKVGDVRQSDEIWFLDINDEGEDQNLKNLSSARSVPLHEKVIEAGFLNYFAERRSKAGPDAQLWPGFEPPIGPAAKAWSKWFGRYLSDYVVNSRSKTFHSFRHTFKRACREAGITEEIHNAFTGHSGGGVGRAYGRVRRSDGALDRGISLARLKGEIDKVQYAGLLSVPVE
jgi:integrase